VAEIIYPESVVERKHPINLKKGDGFYFQKELRKHIPEVDLLRLKNIYVLFNSLFSIKKFSFYHRYTHWASIGLKAKLFRLSLFKKKAVVADKGLWVTNIWGEGYFHWLTDVLPRIMVSKKFLNGHKVILPAFYRRFKYTTDSIKMMSVECIYYDQRTPLLVKDILVPGLTGPTGNYHEELMREMRQFFAGNFSKKAAHRKIYISRRHAPTRQVLNEREMEAVMEAAGFEIHFFEKYDLQRQIELMSETKYLVGVHGAGLTNMLFVKEGGKVFELRNEDDAHNNCYFSLASALGLDYYYQVNKGTNAVTQLTNIEVDIKELKMNLELMLA
jgi:capsular polysaccharide biosynthesis protein